MEKGNKKITKSVTEKLESTRNTMPAKLSVLFFIFILK